MSRRLQHLAILLVLAGVATMVVPTMGFSNVAADRGVSVDVASDPNANLGIVDRSGSADVKRDSPATIYGLNDNANTFQQSDLSATVIRATNGTTINDPGVIATIESGSSDDYAVNLSCNTNSGTTLDGNYEVTVDFSASAGITVDAIRTTDNTIPIDCTYDYSDTSNWRDDDGGGAAQPSDPSGDIQNPGAVNEQDDSTATAISSGGNEDLKVGYALPAVDDTASPYEMFFDIERIQVGGGSFGFYLVDGNGQQLTSRQVLQTGENTYTFSNQENQDIAANADELYLIIDSETNGRGNRELELDYFELRPV